MGAERYKIRSAPVHTSLNFLLDHIPPQLHLVITTREDPPLALPRRRSRGELSELRTADLRFTTAEAAAFLNAVIGLDLPPKDVAALEERTEGWIVSRYRGDPPQTVIDLSLQALASLPAGDLRFR